MKRMEQLYEELAQRRCDTIVEIGTYQGKRARRMAKAAFKNNPAVAYVGFDLFELTNAEIVQSESSLWAPSRAEVEAFLDEFAREAASSPLPWLRKKFTYELHQGFTQETLPAFCESHPGFTADFLFIDGGHSVATIANDWEYCRRLVAPDGVIFLDDYYENDDEIDRLGCNRLIDSLRDDPAWTITLMPVVDPSPRHQGIRLARVQPRAA